MFFPRESAADVRNDPTAKAMQIQINTDNHLIGTDDLALAVDATVRRALSRFTSRLTRVEVHLNDVNSDKGGHDKRCVMEARARGRRPISATHLAPSIALAADGAAEKLARALDRTFGRLDDRRPDHEPASTRDGPLPASRSQDGGQ